MTRVLPALVAIVVGCAPGLQINPGAAFPPPVSDREPALVLPIDTSQAIAAADPSVAGVAVAAGLSQALGGRGVVAQPVLDWVGTLARELPEAIRAQVDEGRFTLNTGDAERIAANLHNLLPGLVAELARRGVTIPEGAMVRYVLTFSSRNLREASAGTARLESIGAVYDTETRQVVSYLRTVHTVENEARALMVGLAAIYEEMARRLLGLSGSR